MAEFLQFLAQNPLALLFLTIGLGYLLSQVRWRGVGLGAASVLFTGLALGAWGGEAFRLPDILAQLGLLLFVYMIGLQAGPAFFRILRKKGAALLLLALASVGLAAGYTWGLVHWLHLNPSLGLGLFCGALTNTPALAVALEGLQGSPEASWATVGYSLAYPLGVVLPMAVAEWIARAGHLNMAEEVHKAQKESDEPMEPAETGNLIVAADALVGLPLGQSELGKMGIRVSRIQRGSRIALAHPGMVLQKGDVLHLVGTHEQLAWARQAVGPPYQGQGPETHREQIDFRRILLTNPQLAGLSLKEVEQQLFDKWGAMVTRIRRGDLDFVPREDTRLERGDRLRIVAPSEHINPISLYLGDSFHTLSEIDFFSLSLGILAGFLLGAVALPLPGGIHLKLGLAGGPLLTALVLGWLGRTGPLIWNLPLQANLTFRQMGLVLFFAGVGLKSGGFFAKALQGPWLLLLGTGALLTLSSCILLLAGALLLLKLDWVSATGILAGGQTQPALLSFADARSHSEAANTAYVAILPAAMIAKILAAQILLWVL